MGQKKQRFGWWTVSERKLSQCAKAGQMTAAVRSTESGDVRYHAAQQGQGWQRVENTCVEHGSTSNPGELGKLENMQLLLKGKWCQAQLEEGQRLGQRKLGLVRGRKEREDKFEDMEFIVELGFLESKVKGLGARIRARMKQGRRKQHCTNKHKYSAVIFFLVSCLFVFFDQQRHHSFLLISINSSLAKASQLG